MKKHLRSLAALILSLVMVLTTLTATPFSAKAAEEDPRGDEVNGLFYLEQGRDSQHEFHYKDSYFYHDSREYDASLGTMSLCLALSAFNAAEAEGGETDFTHRYKNVEDMMTQIGGKNFEVNETYIGRPGTDTIGAAIATKELTMENGEKRSLLMVAIRGGGYGAEWAGNVGVGAEGEHAGFAVARDQVVQFLNEYIDRHQDEITRHPKIWVVGYSRASATANLTGNYLDCVLEQPTLCDDSLYAWTNRSMQKLGVALQDVFCYGFEVPQGASLTSEYSIASDTRNLFCIVNKDDPVTLVAPRTWGFYHYGQEIDLTEGVTEEAFEKQMEIVDAGLLKDYKKKLAGSDFKVFNVDNAITLIKMFLSDTYVEIPLSESKVGTTKAEFLNCMIDEVGRYSQSREAYANDLQPVMKTICRLMMGSTQKQSEKLMAALKKGLGDYFGWGTITDFYALIAFHPFSWQDKLYPEMFEKVSKGIMRAYEYSKNDGVWTYQDAKFIADNVDRFIPLVKAFMWDEKGMQLLPTILYYADSLFMPHYPEYTLGFMRAKDPNYNETSRGKFILTVEEKDGLSLKDVAIDIYALGDNGTIPTKELVGTWTSEGVIYGEGRRDEWVKNVSVTYIQKYRGFNEKIVVRVEDMHSRSGYYIAEVRNASEKYSILNLNTNVCYWLPNTNETKNRNSFTGAAIPVNNLGDTLMIDLEGKTVQRLRKVITVKPVFTDQDFKTIESGTVRFANGANRSIERLICGYEDAYFEVSAPKGYTEFDISTPILNEKGEVQTYENGRPMVTNVNHTPNFNLNSHSGTYYFRCIDEAKAARISAKLVTQDAEYFEDIVTEDLNVNAFTIKNETTGESTTRADQELAASFGDTISVTVNDRLLQDQAYFHNWVTDNGMLADVIANPNTDLKNFTFTMPTGRVDLIGLCTPWTGDTTLTFTGIWADPDNGKPNHSTAKWQIVSVDPAFEDPYDSWHYGYLTKTYKQLRTGAPAEAWITAPDLPMDKYGDLLFDHWSVTLTATGRPVDFRTACLDSTTASPDGCTDRTIHITNIAASITVQPVYVEAPGYDLTVRGVKEYTYTEIPAGRETTTGMSLAEDCHPGSITAKYRPVVEDVDMFGNVTRTLDRETYFYGYSVQEGDSYTLKFTMPRGDMTVTIESEPNVHEVTVIGGMAVTPPEGFIKGARVTILPDPSPRGKILTGWNESVQVDTISSIDGKTDAILNTNFNMPASDIRFEAKYKDLPAYSLKVDGGSVRANGELLEPDGDGFYVAYEGETIEMIPEEREGQLFTSWSVSYGSLQFTEENQATNSFIMPAEDIGIIGEYLVLNYVDKVELVLDYQPEGDKWLPTNAYCETPGITEEWPIAVWDTSKAWMENPAMYNMEYGFSTTLTLIDETYRFADDLKVTLDGKACQWEINENGKLEVSCDLKTDWAYITAIEPVDDVAGVKNGTPLGTAAKEAGSISALLPRSTEVILGSDSLLTVIDWDLDPEKIAYDPAQKENQVFTVTGHICNNLFMGWPYMEENTKLADGVKDEVTCTVTVLAATCVTAPYVTEEKSQPGVFVIDTNGNVKDVSFTLSCDTDHTEIYALLVKAEEAQEGGYTADEIMALGQLCSSDKPFVLSGSLNEIRNYKLYAFACVTEDFTETNDTETLSFSAGDRSKVAVFTYSLREKDLRRFDLTVIGGSGSGIYFVDELLRVTAATAEENTSFTGFSVTPDTLEFLADSTGSMKRFRMPAENVKMVAGYDVNKVRLEIGVPEGGHALPDSVTLLDGTPSAVDGDAVIKWFDEGGHETEGEAEYNASYRVEIRLKIGEDAEGFSFADVPVAQLNGLFVEAVKVSETEIMLTAAFRTDEPAAPALEYGALTILDGNASFERSLLPPSADNDDSYLVEEDAVVMLAPLNLASANFVGWAVRSGAVEIRTDEWGRDYFEMIDDDVIVQGIYEEVPEEVESLDLTLEAPRAGAPLSTSASVAGEGVPDGILDNSWRDIRNGEVEGDADYDSVYRGSVSVDPEEGFRFTEHTVIRVNGEPVKIQLEDDGSATIRFTFDTEDGKYSFIEGQNSSWTPDTEGGLHFKTDGPFEQLKALKVNGVTLAQKYFTVAKGSTLIDLKEEFLRTLEPGTYTLAASYENGACETNFMIGESKMANTGDDSRPVLMLSVFVLSAAALGFTLLRPRRKEEE